MRPSEIVPKEIIPELLRCARLNRNWVQVTPDAESLEKGFGGFASSWKVETPLRRMATNANEMTGLWAFSIWIMDGPKVFKPTPAQMRALEQVELNVRYNDFVMPYSSLCIQVDHHPFKALIVTKGPQHLTVCTQSVDNNDIVTNIRGNSEGSSR